MMTSFPTASDRQNGLHSIASSGRFRETLLFNDFMKVAGMQG
jgi:hypothetical protein